MSYTHAIGWACNKVIRLIVRGLALSRIHPNVLTFLGWVINMPAGNRPLILQKSGGLQGLNGSPDFSSARGGRQPRAKAYSHSIRHAPRRFP